MALGNGLNVREDLDSRMKEYLDKIHGLTDEVSKKNHEITSTEQVLNDLQSEGLVTPELEQNFSSAMQKTLDEKAELERERESILDEATQKLNEAKEEYNKAIERINASAGSQGAEIPSAIRERIDAIDEWEKELHDAMNETDDPQSVLSKRLVLKH